MTIDEAIDRLQRDLEDPGSVDYNDRAKAQQLGIEALKLVMKDRDGSYHLLPLLLPGETKE